MLPCASLRWPPHRPTPWKHDFWAAPSNFEQLYFCTQNYFSLPKFSHPLLLFGVFRCFVYFWVLFRFWFLFVFTPQKNFHAHLPAGCTHLWVKQGAPATQCCKQSSFFIDLREKRTVCFSAFLRGSTSTLQRLRRSFQCSLFPFSMLTEWLELKCAVKLLKMPKWMPPSTVRSLFPSQAGGKKNFWPLASKCSTSAMFFFRCHFQVLRTQNFFVAKRNTSCRHSWNGCGDLTWWLLSTLLGMVSVSEIRIFQHFVNIKDLADKNTCQKSTRALTALYSASVGNRNCHEKSENFGQFQLPSVAFSQGILHLICTWDGTPTSLLL